MPSERQVSLAVLARVTNSLEELSEDGSPSPCLTVSDRNLMTDIRSRPLIVVKGLLFLVMLGLSVGLLLALLPGWRTACLLAVVVWSSARLYYFLFYVLENYNDSSLRYSGLIALLQELVRRSKRSR